VTKNKLNFAETLRAQYGYGDDVQKGQLWDILKGRAEVRVGEGEDLRAETKIDNGKRVIYMSGYQSDMSEADLMRLAVVLGHEAYRDGIVTDDNYLETRMATVAHIEMAKRMESEGHTYIIDKNLKEDLNAYNMGMDYFNSYVDKTYDSSADYWRLTEKGDLEYDGVASLRDADGNVIKLFSDMGLSSDNSIEGALLWLLNIDPNDVAKVSAVRNMMVSSGLKHSFDYNADNWMWNGEHSTLIGNQGSFPVTGIVDLTNANKGKPISMNSIAELFTTVGASGDNVKDSINRIYGSAIGLLNYTEIGGNITIANSILSNYYTPSQITILYTNRNWLSNALENGVYIDGMIRGNPERTSEFNETINVTLKTSSVLGASSFYEIHTGFDYVGGKEIYAPGGAWQLTNTDVHSAYYQLYGGDIKMRIQHLDSTALSSLNRDMLYTGKLVDYPTQSNGTGTNTHIHIDFTRSLPYNGIYTRQFVNPETLQPGNRLEYPYAYMDKDGIRIPNHFDNFNRY